MAVGAETFTSSQLRTIDPNPDATVWVSPDAAVWQEVLGETITPDVPAYQRPWYPPYSVALGGQGSQSLTAVAAFGGGFVTVGGVYDDYGVEPLVVISPDGASLVAEHPDTGPGSQGLSGTCVAGDGAVVAVGESWDTVQSDVFALRRDPAGGWAQATATDESFAGTRDQVLRDCRAMAGGGFVAIGSDGRDVEQGADAAVWTSPDGLSWTRVADPDNALGGENDQTATALVELPDGAVLITIHDARVDAGDIGLVRLDPDGGLRRVDAGEVELRGRGEQSAAGIAVVGPTVVVVGSDLGGAGAWEAPVETLTV